MKYQGVCIAVKDVNLSKKFYQDLFELEVFQDYGINISFGGLSLQQDFDWLLNIPQERILKEPHNMELYFEEANFDDFIAKLEQRDDIKYMGEGSGIEETLYDHLHILANFNNVSIQVVKTYGALSPSRFFNALMAETSKRMSVSVSDLETLLNS